MLSDLPLGVQKSFKDNIFTSPNLPKKNWRNRLPHLQVGLGLPP